MKRFIASLTVAALAFSLCGIVASSACASDSKALVDKTADCCSGSKPAACAAGKTASHAKTRAFKVLMSPKAMVLAGK